MKEVIVFTKKEYELFEKQVRKQTAEKIFAYLENNIKRTRDYRNNGTLFFVSDYDMAHMKEQTKIEFGIEL